MAKQLYFLFLFSKKGKKKYLDNSIAANIIDTYLNCSSFTKVDMPFSQFLTGIPMVYLKNLI